MTKRRPSERVAALWGQNIRDARRARKLTQIDLARLVNLSQTAISRYERGEGSFTPDLMLSFAFALDATVTALFAWPEQVESEERRRRLTGEAVA